MQNHGPQHEELRGAVKLERTIGYNGPPSQGSERVLETGHSQDRANRLKGLLARSAIHAHASDRIRGPFNAGIKQLVCGYISF